MTPEPRIAKSGWCTAEQRDERAWHHEAARSVPSSTDGQQWPGRPPRRWERTTRVSRAGRLQSLRVEVAVMCGPFAPWSSHLGAGSRKEHGPCAAGANPGDQRVDAQTLQWLIGASLLQHILEYPCGACGPPRCMYLGPGFLGSGGQHRFQSPLPVASGCFRLLSACY